MKFNGRKSWYTSIYIHLTNDLYENIHFFAFIPLQSVSENLLQELNRFVEVASQQHARLEVSQLLLLSPTSVQVSFRV